MATLEETLKYSLEFFKCLFLKRKGTNLYVNAK
jgi:hypothetical protein